MVLMPSQRPPASRSRKRIFNVKTLAEANANPYDGKQEMIRLCYRKWLMLFSLKLQRDNRQNALSVAHAKGKTGEKGCIFTVL